MGRSRERSRARVKRRLGASSQRRQRAAERGRRVPILLDKPEPDDQRHELVLDAVVPVTLQPPAHVLAGEELCALAGPVCDRLVAFTRVIDNRAG